MLPLNIFDNILHQLTYIKDEPMIFSSGVFWVLFLIFLPIYAALKNRKRQMMVFVIGFSLFFYYKSSGLFVLMLLGTSVMDWVMSRLMVKTEVRWKRRLCLWASLLTSL